MSNIVQETRGYDPIPFADMPSGNIILGSPGDSDFTFPPPPTPNHPKRDKQGILQLTGGVTYEYDKLGQLTRVNDEYAGETRAYEYDQGGNLLAMKRYAYTAETLGTVLQTVPYTYGNPNWKDQLTAYNGKAITYDAIGNPLTYDGWVYTWKAGRMLERMLKPDLEAMTQLEATFTYDHTGLRVKKSFNGVDTLYTLNGKKITHVRKQVNGENTVRMHFFYDAQGRPSIIRYNDVDYVYVHNLQGDVIAIVDMDGNKVVEYGYDAWGRPTEKTGALAGTLGAENPFRYRGYVWDEETGLYYLRSRYYNPEWGRFLNADVLLGGTGELLGHNVFIYCSNNPVNWRDSSGLKKAKPFPKLSDEDIQALSVILITAYFDPDAVQMPPAKLCNILLRYAATGILEDQRTGKSFVVYLSSSHDGPDYHTEAAPDTDADLAIVNDDLVPTITPDETNWEARPGKLTVVVFGTTVKLAVGYHLNSHLGSISNVYFPDRGRNVAIKGSLYNGKPSTGHIDIYTGGDSKGGTPKCNDAAIISYKYYNKY